jgi:site-specific DNA-methyltransferase (adenine-specific)
MDALLTGDRRRKSSDVGLDELLDGLLPPLSTEEFEALRADIRANGVLHPVFVDENGVVLDGRHRLRIDPKAPRKVIRGLTDGEKQAFVFRCNFVRRNLSPDQKAEAKRKMKETARKLRAEDAKKWTLKKVAASLGVHFDTVSGWFTTNSEFRNGSKPRPDARVKVAPEAKPAIAERVEAGEPQAQVAADIGVSQQAVSRIVKAERKAVEAKKERAAAAKKIQGDCGVVHGDFRKQGVAVEPGSIDLVFTDPPYDEESASLYGDLATFAVRALRPGGWLLCYSGQAHLPRVLEALTAADLRYGWTFCCLHSGGDVRFRQFKLHNGWKPIVALYKPPLQVSWDWFKDVVSGGKEKDSHEWQQAEAEAAHFIERLSSPSGFVCDPFCGSGTTLAAAKRAGRRWIGFEIDEEHVATARLRVHR